MSSDDRQKFIETAPLYTPFTIPSFYPPENVSLFCPVCKKETTWYRTHVGELYGVCAISGFYATYQCVLCKKIGRSVFVKNVEYTKDPPARVVKVQKIGQSPPQTIDVPSDLHSQLGESAAMYKNALICRNFGFGIGALAYVRRVVEDKTNELIELVAKEAESLGAKTEDVAKLRSILEEKTTYDEKIKLASEAIPSTLKPGGANPLGALYEMLSAGLHAKSDEESIAIVDEIREVFEYVFTKLRAEIEERDRMMAKVRKWAEKK